LKHLACAKDLWTVLLMNGTRDFRPVWMKNEAIFNTVESSADRFCG